MTKENKKISKDMTFAEVLKEFPEAAEVFMESGMHCIECPMAQMENIEQGCIAHGIDVEGLIKKLNKVIENGNK